METQVLPCTRPSAPFPGHVRGRPSLVLAPMEGVTDAPMRAFLTRRGAFQFCVSEFVRVSQDVLPKRVFRTDVPEWKNDFRTDSGCMIQVQLLGGHPGRLAESALNALAAGATGIDLNFGCPAPTVNRNDGGATLLQYPHRVREIVSAVRAAVPAEIPVSSKLRLGWENMEDIHANAEAAIAGGSSWITIHARTKMQGYRPPAHWAYLRRVREESPVPVVANGEIWTIEDFRRCREATGCEHYMLGRGALGDPSLASRIARELGIERDVKVEDYDDLHTWEAAFREFEVLSEEWTGSRGHSLSRMKQWLRFAQLGGKMAFPDPLKRATSLDDFYAELANLSKFIA